MPRGVKGGISVEIDGLTDTLKATKQLESDLRKETNGQLRLAARECAAKLAEQLKIAASASGVPVAPNVARSIKVKSDRIPIVTIGGSMKVGHGKRGNAAALVWGSEQGPKGEINHFAVPPSGGYWIAPTTKRFQQGDAIPVYQRAVYEILNEVGLV